MDDIKTSYLCQLFFNLLPINENLKTKEGAEHNSKPYKERFDAELLQRFRDGVFTKEEVIRINEHSKLYFKHFLLYDYVFNNPQICDTKKAITIPHDVPRIAPSLTEALLIVNPFGDQETNNEKEADEEY